MALDFIFSPFYSLLLYGHVASPELVAVCVKIGAFSYLCAHMDIYAFSMYVCMYVCIHV